MKFLAEGLAVVAAAGLSGFVVWRSSPTVADLETLPVVWQTYQLAAADDKQPIVDSAPDPVVQASQRSVVGLFPASIKERVAEAKFSSGVVVNATETSVDILTNRHVVESLIAFDGTQGTGYSGKAAVNANGQAYEATILCISDQPEVDMAVLRIPQPVPELTPVQLPASFDLPAPNTPVWIAGSSGGVYGNLRATQTITPAERSVVVENPANGTTQRYDATKLVWFGSRADGSPAAEPGGSGGAVLDGNGILRAFVFSSNTSTATGAGISLPATLNWLENPSCNQQLRTEETPEASQPQPEPLAKLPVRPIGQRPRGQAKNPDGRDNPAAMPHVEAVYKAVVCVGRQGPPCASGTSIDPQLAGIDPSQGAVVLSNAHVTVGTRQPYIETPDGRQLQTQLLHESRQLDLSLTLVPGQQLPIAPLAPAEYEPEPGTPAWAIGFPGTARGKMVISPDSVIIGMLSECLAQPPCIGIEDGTITNGNSGGALVAGGMLIGVTEGETIEEIAIPPAHIHAFLEEVKAGGGQSQTRRDDRSSHRRQPPRGRG